MPKGNVKKVKAIDDVCGLRAAAGLGTVEEAGFRDVSAKCVAAGKPAVEIVTYPDLPGGVRLVKNGRADILMSGYTVVNQIIVDNGDAFEQAYMIVTDYKIAAALTKGNKDLAQMIKDGLEVTMADGTYNTLLKKYGLDLSLARKPEILTKSGCTAKVRHDRVRQPVGPSPHSRSRPPSASGRAPRRCCCRRRRRSRALRPGGGRS